MERTQFERLVAQALEAIPEGIRARMDNVDVVVEDQGSQDRIAGTLIEDGELLLGLYEGVPLTERDDYGMVLPDKITLFQSSIEAVCSSEEEIVEEVRETVIHEVAHHFGIDDEALNAMGA